MTASENRTRHHIIITDKATTNWQNGHKNTWRNALQVAGKLLISSFLTSVFIIFILLLPTQHLQFLHHVRPYPHSNESPSQVRQSTTTNNPHDDERIRVWCDGGIFCGRVVSLLGSVSLLWPCFAGSLMRGRCRIEPH